MFLVNFVCCQVEVCATYPSLVQRSPTDCGAPECVGKTSLIKNPRFTGGVKPRKKNLTERKY